MNTIHNTSDKLILLLWSLFPTIEIFQKIRSNEHNISFIKKNCHHSLAKETDPGRIRS